MFAQSRTFKAHDSLFQLPLRLCHLQYLRSKHARVKLSAFIFHVSATCGDSSEITGSDCTFVCGDSTATRGYKYQANEQL